MLQLESAVQIRIDKLDQLAAQQVFGLLRIGYPVDAQLLAKRADQLTGRAHAQVGGDQRGLEIVPGLIIDAVARQQVGKRPGQRVVAVRQPAAQSPQARRGLLRLLDLGDGRRDRFDQSGLRNGSRDLGFDDLGLDCLDLSRRGGLDQFGRGDSLDRRGFLLGKLATCLGPFLADDDRQPRDGG